MPRPYAYRVVDVFTDVVFGGNPLAVFTDARGLTEGQMQALARELNLSETTFVLPPADAAHTACVRIFTPAEELPFAGHPNVGTAVVLGQGSDAGRLVFEELAGIVAVDLQRENGAVVGAVVAAPRPLFVGSAPDAGLIAACAGLERAAIAGVPVEAGVGTNFILAELVSIEALRRARPDMAAFERAAAAFGRHFKLHLFVRGTPIATRMFAPTSGIAEDPATGSANAALAAFLLRETALPAHALSIVQGVEMGRPSLLALTASRAPDGAITATVGGRCVGVAEGVFTL